MTDRKSELADGLAEVRERIDRACDAAGRSRTSVTLIVVTKTFPAEDVRLLAELGVRDVAENREQEATPKAAACTGLGLNWHFVGQLQTNKTRPVLSYADFVHSVDRPRLVRALSAAAVAADRDLGVLLQVALGDSTGVSGARGGVSPTALPELADAVAGAERLRLAGVMAVAPLSGAYAGRPGAAFERLREISTGLQAGHPGASMVSAGMSADLEEAVTAGATHVRVGSAVLGHRSRLR